MKVGQLITAKNPENISVWRYWNTADDVQGIISDLDGHTGVDSVCSMTKKLKKTAKSRTVF